MKTKAVSLHTKQFAKLFNSLSGVEIIPWTGHTSIGISILKNYPDEGRFIPIKNSKNEHDSVALIKIGYSNEYLLNKVKKFQYRFRFIKLVATSLNTNGITLMMKNHPLKIQLKKVENQHSL